MNKGEFIVKYNIANQVANTAYNKLGLSAKRWMRAYNDEYTDLSDQEYFIKAAFAELDENKKAKKDQQGLLIMDSSKEKELSEALKAWKKEPIEFELDNFIPVKIEGKQLFMSPAIYEELNGHVFNVSEEEYYSAVEAEIAKQNSETK